MVAVLILIDMNLPIFRDLYRLNVALLKDIENIPKIHRHTLGDRIINMGLSSLYRLQQAYDAQSPTKRLYEMGNFATELSTLTMYLRIANESRLIPLKRATDLFVQLDHIKKQLAGWKKATKDKMK